MGMGAGRLALCRWVISRYRSLLQLELSVSVWAVLVMVMLFFMESFIKWAKRFDKWGAFVVGLEVRVIDGGVLSFQRGAWLKGGASARGSWVLRGSAFFCCEIVWYLVFIMVQTLRGVIKNFKSKSGQKWLFLLFINYCSRT